ncbi:MAG: hypothetical protein QXI39_09525 [Candidatus Bathyarchaeia archaeon]
MIAGMYLHPWDLFDDGPKVVFDHIVDRAGLNSVNLATTYHGGPPFRGGFFLPHNLKRRLYIPEAGVVYFKPHLELYRNTRLKPIPSRQLSGYDALEVATEEAERRGVGVSSWTICSRNERLAAENPEFAMENIFGLRDPTWLCPNNPDAREYLLALIEDITSNYRVDGLELESLGFGTIMPPPRGLVVDRIVGRLLTLCFCEACRRAAKDAGYDWEAMTGAAKAMMEVYLDLGPEVWDAIARGAFSTASFTEIQRQVDGLSRFEEFQSETVLQCLKDVRDRTRGSRRKVKIAFPMDLSLPLKRLQGIVDNFMISPQGPQQLKHQAAILRFIVPGAGIQVGFNLLPGAYNLSPGMVDAIKSEGVDTINFYNYGNAHPNCFDAIKVALAPIRPLIKR